jgi:DNA topoisomerase-2
MTSQASTLSKYQKLTDKEHILKKPDTYIGSIENTEHTDYIFSGDKDIISKEFQYIPGLYKLFDEGIVNCRDHVIRQAQAVKDKVVNALPVSNIEITIDDDGTIHMYNDGNGIDVAEHPEYKIWIPEMIFGHLRTSTNYDEKKKEKIVGGKNGFGFKLVLIWSTWGKVETVDHVRGLKYVQEFENNLNVIGKPSITKCKNKPYTRVSFRPDYERLGIQGLTQDMLSLFKKRVYDVSAVTEKTVKVKFNGQLVPCKNFEQYIDLYIGSKVDTKRIYETANDRWEYAVCLAPKDEFQQISFVNGIYTSKGGKHVEYIMNQIIRKLCVYIKTKKKVDVKPNTIKEQLLLFLRCDIENPSFNSQTKDELGTAISSFGSTCTVSDGFVEKIAKMGVMNAACALTQVKEDKAAKKTDGSKSKSIRGIPKLIDANYAGTTKSSQCTLILCEGDSAKAGIVSGLSKDDRNTIGVYPMKGKIFNTRGETLKRIGENKEIIELKQILGLEAGKKYTKDLVEKTLRYSSVLFMTDQDLDGSHIKGLGLNLFQDQWNTLATLENFIGFMNTPILKAKKGGKELLFYNDGEYNKWKSENDVKGWNVKYYKGLGTSTGKEFKEYFANKKIVYFTHEGVPSDNVVDMVFNKKRSDERKEWLTNYDRNSYLDTNNEKVSYTDFVNRELIHFSKYDCERSIPNMMDGLKISLRKILYSSFKKNLTSEIKVAQFSGYVSEQSGYHHGEASLNAAIVGMAQDYVGSNNINLLLPNGQFGTRLQGGKDSASERYIFTQLNPITRYIYRKEDDDVLEYLEDDGFPVEPLFYVPIIPMILVNGGKGIGTGFSTDVLSYSPERLIEYLQCKLKNEQDGNLAASDNVTQFQPSYRGFMGSCHEYDNGNKYIVKGTYQKLNDKKVRVTELPIGHWTDDFKQHIENLMEADKNKKGKAFVKDYNDMSTDTRVDIEITMNEAIDEKTDGSNLYNNFEKMMKLYTSLSTNNMHLFTDEEKLTKFENEREIIDRYFPVRLKYYQKRKDYMIAALEKELCLLSNKARYIQAILGGEIDLRNMKKGDIVNMMSEMKYDMIDDDTDYKYLLKMAMDSVSEENVERLLNDRHNKQGELCTIQSTTIENMWLNELEELKRMIIKKNVTATASANASATVPKTIKIKKVVKKTIAK